MRRLILPIALLTVSVGCDSGRPREDGSAHRETYRCIHALTNQTVRAIVESRGILTNLVSIAERPEQAKAVREWGNALRSIRIDKADPLRLYSSVIAASRTLNDGVVGALRTLGASDKELWEARFSALAWLDEQVRRIDPETLPRPQRLRETANLWHCYRGLVVYRECVVENLELIGFEDLSNHSDREFVKGLFEKQVGRAARPSAEITRRGFFAKKRDAELKSREKESLRTVGAGRSDSENKELESDVNAVRREVGGAVIPNGEHWQ